ncbi:MAG TPA: NfeD family protein [Gammaproteobacteria bacterium]|jgi:membrane protein implicated in regulation of membrane protease activity|nr:NfeD family protein [Gammaproteobacteria bacterium]
MEMLFSNIDFWDWLIFGTVLVIVEMFVASTFFLWMGVSAIIVGIILKIIPTISGNLQLLIFAFLAVSSIYVANKFFKVETVDTQLNERSSRHVGNIYTVVELSGDGAKVKVGDSLWLARGCEMSIGQKVKVVDTDSTTLIVEETK